MKYVHWERTDEITQANIGFMDFAIFVLLFIEETPSTQGILGNSTPILKRPPSKFLLQMIYIVDFG